MSELLRASLDVLESVFVVGCLGSAVVLCLTAIEDVKTVLTPEETPPDNNMQ